MVDRILALPEGTRLYLLAPIVRGRKGEYRKELAELAARSGFQRVKIDGAFHEIDEAPALDKKFKHDIEVVVDRNRVRPDIARLGPRQTALALADGIAIAETAPALDVAWPDGPVRAITRGSAGQGQDGPPAGGAPARRRSGGARRERNGLFSEKFACPVSGFTIPEIEPRLFSFNNPFGACPTCDGLGSERKVDPDLVVPDER